MKTRPVAIPAFKIAFWNLKRANRFAVDLVRSENPDLLVLAECTDPDGVLAGLRALSPRWTRVHDTEPQRVEFFTKSEARTELLSQGLRHAILGVHDTPLGSLLIAGAHFRSRMHAAVGRIAGDAAALRSDVLNAERESGHRRTVLIGDFNLNPFDRGLSSRDYLWGSCDKRLARRLMSSAATQESAFYNPSWSRMGDESIGPSGTYYTASEHDLDHRFHTFDQALIRPSLLDSYEAGGLHVLKSVGTIDLTSANGIPTSRGPDHLPIILELGNG